MVSGVQAAIGHDSFKNSSQLPALLAVTARALGVNMLSWQKSALHRFASLDIGDRYRVALVSLGSRYQIASKQSLRSCDGLKPKPQGFEPKNTEP